MGFTSTRERKRHLKTFWQDFFWTNMLKGVLCLLLAPALVVLGDEETALNMCQHADDAEACKQEVKDMIEKAEQDAKNRKLMLSESKRLMDLGPKSIEFGCNPTPGTDTPACVKEEKYWDAFFDIIEKGRKGEMPWTEVEKEVKNQKEEHLKNRRRRRRMRRRRRN